MAWSWGAVTLAFDEEPIGGQINFARRVLYAFANPRGATGRLHQKLSTDALDGTVQMHLRESTMQALDAIYQAGASVEHVNPRSPYDLGIMVTVISFKALWDLSVPGTPDTTDEIWYNCTLEQVEDVT